LRAVQDAQNLDGVSCHPIHNNIGRARYNPFSRAIYTPDAAALGVLGKDQDAALDGAIKISAIWQLLAQAVLNDLPKISPRAC
jgi:hypothetical protein